MRLFSYLSDKDIFAEFYKKQLAKRLLLARSSSDDAERAMIAKLKLRCGAQFTPKLRGHGHRHEPLVGHAVAFASKASRQGNSAPDRSLRPGPHHWPGPTYKSDDLNLPSEMLQCIETFKTFYDARTSHRRLRWVHSLGSATVLGSFTPNGKPKKHDLMVSTYQACILLIFNEQDTHSFSDMQQSLNLPTRSSSATRSRYASVSTRSYSRSPPRRR